MLEEVGERARAVTAGGVTVIFREPLIVVPVTSAVMLVLPAVTPVANPVVLTEAMAEFAEVQVESAVTLPVVPLL
jgi:hypothetical protein